MILRSGITRLAGAGLLAAAAVVPAVGQPVDAGPQPLRLGLIAPHRDAPVIEGLSEIRSALSLAVGAQIEVFVARDYPALVQAQVDGRVDYAVYSAVAYAAASLRCGCVRAVVAPVDRNGAIGLRSVLVRRAGAAEPSPRIAVGPRDSLAGRLAPLAALPAERVKALATRLVEADSLASAEAMFLDGSADGFFGWTLAWDDDPGAPAGGTVARLRQAGLGPQDYRIEWMSEPLRYGPHAVREDVAPELVERLVAFMTGPGSDDDAFARIFGRHHGGGLAAVSHEDYAPVIGAVAALAGSVD